MIPKKILDAMNKQLQMELEASYSYLGMGAWLDSENLPGAAAWMRAQSNEEKAHAMKFYEHIMDRGGKVTFGALSAPKAQFKSVLTVFESALANEEKVTASINALFSLVRKEGDFGAEALLQWFSTEQLEEEKTFSDIISKLKAAERGDSGLILFDQMLAARK